MNNNHIYPWLQPQWNRLLQIPRPAFPHALIITGMQGVGKQEFCRLLSQSLLCENSIENGFPCGVCASCSQFSAHSHGDFFELNPEDGKNSIGIDQVREAINWVQLTHQAKQKKVLLISQAQLMTLQACNALLKTLEEPPANMVIILLCEKLKSLIATIRSRCQIIFLPKPDKITLKNWIDENYAEWELSPENKNYLLNQRETIQSLALNMPLRLKKLLSGDSLQQRKSIIDGIISIVNDNKAAVLVASELSKMEIKDVIYWFQLVLFDLIYIHYKMDDKQLVNKDYYSKLQLISGQLNSLLLFELIKDINQYYQYQSIALNKQLLLDGFMIKWQNCLIKL